MYPNIKKAFSRDELIEYFTLDQSEINIINKLLKSHNKLGFAILVKTFLYLGYYPEKKKDIPDNIINYLSEQLRIKKSFFNKYKWKSITWRYHQKIIRKLTKFTSFNEESSNYLSKYIMEQSFLDISKPKLMKLSLDKCREIKYELPSEKELTKLINNARKLFLESFYKKILDQIGKEKIDNIESFLLGEKEEKSYNYMKQPSGKVGLKSIMKEIDKLKVLKSFDLKREIFANISSKVINTLYRRIITSDASMIKRYKSIIRQSLLSIFVYIREGEITDNIIKLFLELTKKIEKTTDKTIEKNMVSNVKKYYDKNNILRKLTLAITSNPNGSIEEVIFPIVGLDTFNNLKEQYATDNIEEYNTFKLDQMKKKYTKSYRRMIKPVFDILEFKSNNRIYDNLLLGMKLVHKYIDSKNIYYPIDENIPMDLITKSWKKLTIEESSKCIRVKKNYFELCVLEKLERALKCKEIYVEGSIKFCNPDNDLPKDWNENKNVYYNKLKIPIEADKYIEPIKEKMIMALDRAEKYFNNKREVYIFQSGKSDKGMFHVPKIKAKEESLILNNIKDTVINEYGIIDLLDILLEADRLVDFSRFFHTSSQRQTLTKEQIRERVLLNIFSLGTNTGLKRIYSSANPNCEYRDLLYFRKRFLDPSSFREAIIALTNKILQIRNPQIWGNTTVCASDGKQFGSWDQNLMTDSNPHYTQKGIMAYWHVDKNSLCIYSQIKNCNSSEIIPMIEGIVKHSTIMKLESNYVDSAGQTEVAFAICNFLGVDLKPRLKRIKYQRLYLPDKNMSDDFPALRGVLTRPINWELIYSQYDEMVKHVYAISSGIASTESILRRFTSYNLLNPTYKAFKEVGRANKTIFLCKYLTDKSLRVEINEGLNVVENWNSANSFICYGNKSELQTNDPVIQEMIILSLHLLQNAVILVNTIMIDRIIKENGFLKNMKEEDLRALTPLYTSNINPYGIFTLDLNKPSFLEAA